MPDGLLETFHRYGTNAERLAFTPDPPTLSGSAVKVLYEWYETDTGNTYVYDTSWHQIAGNSVTAVTHTVGIVIDGGGSAITTGVKGFVQVPFAGTIASVTLLSSDASATSGSIVIDIWKDTYANYPPTIADTITAAAKPTLSAANKYTDSTLTGWTTSLTAGDVLGFNVDSCSGITRATLQMKVTATT